MRLNKLWKRFLAVTLSAALALGVPVAAGPRKAEAEAVPEPIYENDFEAADAADGDKGKVKGLGNIESSDVKHGKVFHNAEGGVKENYYLLPDNVFSDNAEAINQNKGVTISFELNANGKANFNSPIFSAYAKEPEGKVNTFPMFIIQGRQIIQYNASGYCNFENTDNVLETNVVSTEYMDDNEWHTVTVTLSTANPVGEKTGTAVFYIDGVAVNTWNYTELGSVGDGFLSAGGIGSLKYICLGGNQAWEWQDSVQDVDPAYLFDNLKIYSTALTADQVTKIYEDTLVKVDTITITPDSPTAVNKYTYASEADKANNKIAKSELGSEQPIKMSSGA